MRKYFNIAIASICSFLILSPAFSANNSESKVDNIKLLTEQYSEFLEKKNASLMNKYIAKNVKFYRNFDAPEDYEALHEHVIAQNEKCIELKILPFDEVVASGNKVVALYTLSCVDKFNVAHNKRIMSIAEFDKHRKVSKIWQVAHDEK